jgi:acetolactate synthase I/II/III large subunit
MNGAESLIRTAVAAGVEVCFANPGTTEMPLVIALDKVPGIRAVLGLFEGVCTGAADGYGRMLGKPALTLLHLGPGFANGIANLHNARRARSPIVNLIGDHATWHVRYDAPLTSDIVSLAKPVSAWVRTTGSSSEVAGDGSEAIAAALRYPGQVATLIVPSDCQQGESGGPVLPHPRQPAAAVPENAVSDCAAALTSGKATALLLGGPALLERGLRAGANIAASTGCRLLCDTFPARLERGAGLPVVEKLPYFPEQAIEMLSRFAFLILAGTSEPVSFFGYPGIPSQLTPAGCAPVVLSRPDEDCVGALETLAGRLNAGKEKGIGVPAGRPARPVGALTTRSLGEAVAALQPEGTIIMNEGATSGLPHFLASAGAPRFTYLTITGGAIGQGLPCATGAAVACPDRKVVALQADGSGMYTLQALWTQAREGLDVTTIICANRSYRVLRVELARAGVTEPGPQAVALTDLTRPVIDWVGLARSMGVRAARVETADALVVEFERALAEPGPNLIEAILP